MKNFLNKNKYNLFFCLSFTSSFSLYFWDYIKIKNFFFVPIIYENSHFLFLYGIFYLFFLFFLSFGALLFLKKKNILLHNLFIAFLLIISIESLKDYFALYINKYLYFFLIILFISSILTTKSNSIVNIVTKFFGCFFIFYFVLIYLAINIYFERNYNFNNLQNLKIKKDKLNIIIVFDELDWRILNEKKYQNYNFNHSFKKLLKNSTIYNNSYINGNVTKTNLNSIINNKDYELEEIDLIIKNYKKNKLREISNYYDNLFKKLKKKNKNIGYIGYYFQECNVYKKQLEYCQYLNSGYRKLNKFPKDFYFYNLNKINPFKKKEINFENFFEKQYKNYISLNTKVLEEVIDSNLDVIFMHIPFPHGPYIYDIKKKKFEDIYTNKNYDRDKKEVKHEHYLGNIFVADLILKKILELEIKYKKKINYFILSDTGINKDLDDYANLNSSKYSKKLQTGHTVLFYKKFDSSSKKIINEKVFSPDILHYKLFSLF